ncbi:hypothetical protein GcC1_012042, partial [Golovinomyces cichoracearum]
RSHFERHVLGTSRPPPPYANSKEKRFRTNFTVPTMNSSVMMASQLKSTYAAVTEASSQHQHPLPPKPMNIIPLGKATTKRS